MSYWNGCRAIPANASQWELERQAASNEERVLACLWDMQWHTSQELSALVGHRFGASKANLVQKGWDIECERFATKVWRYRLCSRTRGPEKRRRVKIYAFPEDVDSFLAGTVTRGMREAVQEAVS